MQTHSLINETQSVAQQNIFKFSSAKLFSIYDCSIVLYNINVDACCENLLEQVSENLKKISITYPVPLCYTNTESIFCLCIRKRYTNEIFIERFDFHYYYVPVSISKH